MALLLQLMLEIILIPQILERDVYLSSDLKGQVSLQN